MEADRDNIENQRPLTAAESPCVGETVELPPDSNSHQAGAETVKTQAATGASKLKVTVKSWTGCAVWKWLANDDTCGICRVAFDGWVGLLIIIH